MELGDGDLGKEWNIDIAMTDTDLYFKFKCREGMDLKRFTGNPIYEERLNYEYDVITKMGYSGYFLVVADVLKWARKNNILHGPGRGSVGGSLCAHLLGITALDPVYYELFFERFLNPARVSMPDADLDFEKYKRNQVIEYVREKYGKDYVSHIGTFGSMKAKAAIRDICRTLGYDYEIGNKLAKLTLPPIEGKPQSLTVCFDKVPELNEYRNLTGSPEQEILLWAERLEDRPRALGTHASGILISSIPITDRAPLFLGKDKEATSQFDMGIVEEVGLVKFDFLGLLALDTISNCLTLIEQNTGEKINIDSIPVDDQDVYRLFREGKVEGLFQAEGSGGFKDLLVRAQPTNLDDLSALNALFRPGPLSNGMTAQYVKIKSGEAQPEYYLPALEPILKKTVGVLVYQEQVLEICKQLAGYSLAEADLVRRAIGKKKAKEMEAQRDRFYSGMESKGYTKEQAIKVFADIETNAGYSFNSAHSYHYSFLSYQMAWLKAHYPAEFFCSCLTSDAGEPEKVIRYINAAEELGIKVLPPGINESASEFSVSKDRKFIRFGLSAIKNVGVAPIRAIREETTRRPFTDLVDFLSREGTQKVNKKHIESLILSGTFDSLYEVSNRAQLIDIVDQMWEYREELKRYNSKYETFLKKIQKYKEREEEIKNGAKKSSLVEPQEPEKPDINFVSTAKEYSFLEKLTKEKELLGFFVSGNPLDRVPELNKSGLVTIEGMDVLENKTKIMFIAMVSVLKEITTKKKKERMAFVTLEDKTGTVEGTISPAQYMEYKDLIQTGVPLGFTGAIEEITTEATETEESHRVTKVRIFSVTALRSQNIKEEVQEVKVSAHLLRKFIKWIKENKGTDERKVNIVVTGRNKRRITRLNSIMIARNAEWTNR